ncbi:MAG: hypothetical protein EA401_07535 [Planctomycetota bacterium]|nr:MAG: hypothetical protein EA401_07535 [Planctomycetota bacterium]
MYSTESKKYSKELNGALGLAHLAGSVMMHYYDTKYTVSMKPGEATPESAIFTEIDGRIDKIVADYFGSTWPEDKLLTEERVPDEDWYRSKRIWMVDPIDGTMGFKGKTGHFGFSVALIQDGRPVVGVLYAPAMNLLAWAVAGEGVRLNGEPVHLSEGKCETFLCSKNAEDRPVYERALQLIDPSRELRSVTAGSVVVKTLLLLRGDAQLYPTLPLSEETRVVPKFWDVAAADVIIREAGGRMTTFCGECYRYDISDFRCVRGFLMGTSSAHATVLKRIKKGV